MRTTMPTNKRTCFPGREISSRTLGRRDKAFPSATMYRLRFSRWPFYTPPSIYEMLFPRLLDSVINHFNSSRVPTNLTYPDALRITVVYGTNLPEQPDSREEIFIEQNSPSEKPASIELSFFQCFFYWDLNPVELKPKHRVSFNFHS